MGEHHEDEQDAEGGRRDDEEVHRDQIADVVAVTCGDLGSRRSRNVRHVCEGGLRVRTMYLATVVWETSMPILRSSPWIRGALHKGLAALIFRIS